MDTGKRTVQIGLMAAIAGMGLGMAFDGGGSYLTTSAGTRTLTFDERERLRKQELRRKRAVTNKAQTVEEPAVMSRQRRRWLEKRGLSV
jgi:hypothetical protein